MSGEIVSQVLNRVLGESSGLRSITIDHATQLQSRALADWPYRRRFSSTSFGWANPWKMPSLSRLTGDYAMNVECTPGHLTRWAQAIIEAWRVDYNHHRSHSSSRFRNGANVGKDGCGLTMFLYLGGG